MIFRKKTLWGLIIFLVVFQISWLVFLSSSSNGVDSQLRWLSHSQSSEKAEADLFPQTTPHRAYSLTPSFYDEAFIAGEKQIIKSAQPVFGGIIPHHLTVKDKLAAYFSSLKEQNYQTIILIGPNHRELGPKKILLSSSDWETPYGSLETEQKLIAQIIKNTSTAIFSEAFNNEQAISGLVPFIKKTWPEAKIVPIILGQNTTLKEAEDLSKNIFTNVDVTKTLVLASVDFSHYQPTVVADFHDKQSAGVIKNFAYENLKNLDIDSSASLAVVLKYLEKAGAQKSQLLWQTNSGRLANKLEEPSTSHQFYYFTYGEPIKERQLSFLWLGDLMLDRHVGEKIKNNDLSALFKNLAGTENRFFLSSDIVGANLEGAVTNKGSHYSPQYSYDFAFHPDLINKLKDYRFNFFNVANNHFTDQGDKGVQETRKNLVALKFNFSGSADSVVDDYSSKVVEVNGQHVALVGLSMVYHQFDLEKAKELIKKDKSQADLVVVNIHWGVEYQHQFNKIQQNIAHALIDSGADFIIGHHPHVVQGMEIYKNKPIFYSLGNFIFDQYFSSDTQEGLAVGINMTGKTTNLFLFPMQSKGSVASLMVGADKQKFLERFISWSKVDSSLIKQLKSQMFILEN